MSNQESQDQSNTTEKTVVNKKRRIILGAGAVAPVVLSLVSPSVFGVDCLSQALSGNTSHHSAGGSCVQGFGPSYWKLPANEPNWITAGFVYQTGGGGGDCGTFTGGTAFNNPLAFNAGSTLSMREILCTDATSLDSHLIAALLNAHFVSNYVLDHAQVLGLQDLSITPPGGDVVVFLASTFQ